MDTDLPTKYSLLVPMKCSNKLQITSYMIGENLYEMINNSSGMSEKEKISKYVFSSSCLLSRWN